MARYRGAVCVSLSLHLNGRCVCESDIAQYYFLIISVLAHILLRRRVRVEHEKNCTVDGNPSLTTQSHRLRTTAFVTPQSGGIVSHDFRQHIGRLKRD